MSERNSTPVNSSAVKRETSTEQRFIIQYVMSGTAIDMNSDFLQIQHDNGKQESKHPSPLSWYQLAARLSGDKARQSTLRARGMCIINSS